MPGIKGVNGKQTRGDNGPNATSGQKKELRSEYNNRVYRDASEELENCTEPVTPKVVP